MNTRGRARREHQAAAPTPASSPDISTKSKHTSGSESATLAATASTFHEGGAGETPSVVIAASASVTQNSGGEDLEHDMCTIRIEWEGGMENVTISNQMGNATNQWSNFGWIVTIQ